MNYSTNAHGALNEMSFQSWNKLLWNCKHINIQYNKSKLLVTLISYFM